MKHQQTVQHIAIDLKGKDMTVYNVVEKFISINGEGRKAGQLSVFIRFKGCNLNCSYCDTSWANTKDVPSEEMTWAQIYNYIKEQGIKNVTLTGGEPLLQKNIRELIEELTKSGDIEVEIETNGSVSIEKFLDLKKVSYTIDYKLPTSGMENSMNMINYQIIRKNDTVKFVAGSKEDLEKAHMIIKKYDLVDKCSIYLSPVFGKIEPANMVEFLMNNKLNGVNLQLQLHKYIWDPALKGV